MALLYNSTNEIDLIVNHDVEDFLKIQGITDKKIFYSKPEFLNYIYQYDLEVFLGLHSPFRCLFHEDNKPSASIRFFNQTVYLYKCFGQCKEEKSFNIIGIVKKLCDCSYTEALQYIAELLYCKLEFDFTFCPDVSEVLDDNVRILSNLEEKAPMAYKIIGAEIRMLFALYHEGYKVKAAVNDEVLVSCSSRYLKSEHPLLKNSHTSVSLAVLAFFGLIERVPLYSLPTKRLKQIEALSRYRESPHFRLISQISIKHLDETIYDTLEENADKWKEYGFKKREFTFSHVGKLAGPILANKLFPQA